MKHHVLKVGDGRGFVVDLGNRQGRAVITAAHCLPQLPSCHLARYPEDETYQALLGHLGDSSSVWAACRFVDPMADLAVLIAPDSQVLHNEADAYDELLAQFDPLPIADAPVMGRETITVGGGAITIDGQTRTSSKYEIERETAGVGPVHLCSLDGRWIGARVSRRHGWLWVEPGSVVIPGMSGSPILSPEGAAIGVCSTGGDDVCQCPVLVDKLSAELLREIQRESARQ